MKTYVLSHPLLWHDVLMYRDRKPDLEDIVTVLARYGVHFVEYPDYRWLVREEERFDFGQGVTASSRRKLTHEERQRQIRKEIRRLVGWWKKSEPHVRVPRKPRSNEDGIDRQRRAYRITQEIFREAKYQNCSHGVRVESPDGGGGESGSGKD